MKTQDTRPEADGGTIPVRGEAAVRSWPERALRSLLRAAGMAVFIVAIAGLILFGLCHFGMVCSDVEQNSGAAHTDLQVLQVNIVRYKTMAGSFPTQVQGLAVLAKKPSGMHDSRQLMDPKGLTDPWGHPYQYRNPGRKNPSGYDIYSLGVDGQDGTADDIYPESH